MRRRSFLAGACAGGLAGLARTAPGADTSPMNKEYYELRLYRVGSADQRKALDEFLGKVAVAAWNRAGAKPVGAFQPAEPATKGKATDRLEMGPLDVCVLLPHKSAESLVTCRARLLADKQYLADGEPFLKRPKNDPLYQRIESWVLLAFDAVPKVEVPSTKDTRVFQLRVYEAHSVERNVKKVEMFNAAGEVAIFRKCGMNPVFFGEALFGTRIPNLTYMIGFDDGDAQKAGWKKFMGHPDWKKISRDPAYKDTVSRISNIVLRPTAYSQI
ncbi:MAG: NIPSNAP family protein [Phycisphaerae bacterium]